MKGKKLIACIISVLLMMGLITPVYGTEPDTAAETAVGAANVAGLVGGAKTPEELRDESLAAIAEAENIQNEENQEIIGAETDAVPENVESATGDESAITPETMDSSVSADALPSDASTDSSVKTESKTDSLTDSSLSDLSKEQELLVGAKYTSAVPADGKTYYIRCATNKNFCVTVNGSSVANGANMIISKLTNSLKQKFMCRKLSDGTFVFTNLHSGKAIRIEGNTAKNYANLWQYEFSGARSGRWKPIKNSDGSYRIASMLNSNIVFDVYAGSIAENSNLQVYKSNNTAAQKFIFTEAPIPNYAGDIQMRPTNALTKCVAPAKNSKASGADIQLTNANNKDNLKYTAVHYVAGYYILVNKSNGMALTVENNGSKSGCNVVQEKRTNKFSQQWLIRRYSDGTFAYLPRANSSISLCAKGGGISAGTTMIVTTFRNLGCQKFVKSVYTPDFVPTNAVYIRNVKNTDRVLDVSAAGTADGTNIDQYDWNETAAQKFKLEPVAYGNTTNTWYKITATASGKCLQVAGGSAHEHANIELGTYRGTKAQLWDPMIRADGSFILRSCLNTKMVIESTGSEAYGTNVRLATYQAAARQRWYFTCVRINKNTISSSDHNTVTVTASGGKQQSDTGYAYLFAVEPYETTVKNHTPLAHAAMATSYTFKVKLNKNSSNSLLQKKFYIATVNRGIYRIISNGYYIQNPQAAATNTKAFPKAAHGTKKGIKTSADSVGLAKNLNCSHVVLDLPIDGFLSGSDLAYQYEGKTYHFSSIINVYGDRIKTYNNAGIVVTGIFYLYDGSNTNYMYPAAASGSRKNSATLYALNTKNSHRKRLEALFACLAEKWSTNGITLANWIYGNEVQQYNVYNYTGDVSYSEYHEALAEGFRMFNASIKSRWSNARTYISLDHNWNLSWSLNGSYNGMKLTADFNTDLKRQGLCHWDMAMHPYPSPEQDCRFWNRVFTIENSGASQQITMLNARYFASYIKNTYGSGTHIIMSETGLSSVYQGHNYEGQQAASVAFAYYLAEFDPNIDMLAIHRDYDNSGETSGGWWLGIYHSNGSAKPSADVFKYMDTKHWNSHVSHYMNAHIGSNWKSQINGFNANFFNNK